MLRTDEVDIKSALHHELRLRYREFFESKLAVELLKNSNLFQSVRLISEQILKLIENNINKILQIFEDNPTILVELREPYFGSCYDGNQDVTPHQLLEKIRHILADDKAELKTIMQIHSIFVYRVYDILEKNSEKPKWVSQIFTDILFNKDNRVRTERKKEDVKSTMQLGISRSPVFCKKLGLSDKNHISALEKFKFDSNACFFKSALQKGIPVVCGPSGHTGSLMLGARLYGNLNKEQLKEYAWASFAFLAASGNHSFYEVMLVAAAAGAEVHAENYAASIPSSFNESLPCKKMILEF